MDNPGWMEVWPSNEGLIDEPEPPQVGIPNRGLLQV